MNTLTLTECGRLAHEALASGGGEVRAVFRRSVYLCMPGRRYVCLGDATLGHGPLNAVVAEARALTSLQLGAHVAVRSGNEIVWSPAPRVARLPSRAALAANLRSLDRALADRKSCGDLRGALVDEVSPWRRHARPALRAFDRWLRSAATPVPPAVHALLGLGPGLTPSGDDYLAGALVALRAIGKDVIADRLWDGLRIESARRTHPISRAHLAAAAAGQAHEALHLCVEPLFGDGEAEWKDSFARLDRVGHSSGWDGLDGVVAVARSALRERRSLQ